MSSVLLSVVSHCWLSNTSPPSTGSRCGVSRCMCDEFVAPQPYASTSSSVCCRCCGHARLYHALRKETNRASPTCNREAIPSPSEMTPEVAETTLQDTNRLLTMLNMKLEKFHRLQLRQSATQVHTIDRAAITALKDGFEKALHMLEVLGHIRTTLPASTPLKNEIIECMRKLMQHCEACQHAVQAAESLHSSVELPTVVSSNRQSKPLPLESCKRCGELVHRDNGSFCGNCGLHLIF